MKKFETFSEWAKDQEAYHKKAVVVLRRLVKETAPSLSETVNWGNGCWVGKEWPVLFLHAKEDHLQFGFFSGSELKDPKKLLKGSGKYIKHLKVYTVKDINTSEFKKLIRQAVKYERS